MLTDQLSATFAALADSTRRGILERLASGEASVSELAPPFSMSAPAISKHLKVLESVGLIKRRADARWRLCSLDAKPLREASDWVGQYRKFWESNLDSLEGYLRELQQQRKEQEDAGHGDAGAST